MGIGDMLQAQADAQDAKRYRYLLRRAKTTAHLWNLLASGDKGTETDFNKMVDRIMESEEAAYERGRHSTSGAKS